MRSNDHFPKSVAPHSLERERIASHRWGLLCIFVILSLGTTITCQPTSSLVLDHSSRHSQKTVRSSQIEFTPNVIVESPALYADQNKRAGRSADELAPRGRVPLKSPFYNYDSVIADLTSALELRPDDATILCERGVVFYFEQKFEAAEADFQRAFEIDSTCARALNNLGVLAEEKGQIRKARLLYDDAIALDSKYGDAFANRANVRYLSGDRSGALSDLEAALALNGRMFRLLVDKGTILASQGDHAAALLDYMESLEAKDYWVGSTDVWEKINISMKALIETQQ